MKVVILCELGEGHNGKMLKLTGDMPAAPVVGLGIWPSSAGIEIFATQIYWRPEKGRGHYEVWASLDLEVGEETIDTVMEKFRQSGWEAEVR